MEQRAPPAERNELISHIDQSFVTGSCWRMHMLCVSCEFVYMVPSIAMLAEMLLPLSVCVSIVLPQVDQNGRGSVLRRDADAQRAGRRALIGQNQVLERNIQRAVCRGEVDMVLGERRE